MTLTRSSSRKEDDPVSEFKSLFIKKFMLTQDELKELKKIERE